MKKPTPIRPLASVKAGSVDRAVVEAELADYERQRAEAQAQCNVWQQKVLLADGAFQACAALLKKLDTKEALDATLAL